MARIVTIIAVADIGTELDAGRVAERPSLRAGGVTGHAASILTGLARIANLAASATVVAVGIQIGTAAVAAGRGRPRADIAAGIAVVGITTLFDAGRAAERERRIRAGLRPALVADAAPLGRLAFTLAANGSGRKRGVAPMSTITVALGGSRASPIESGKCGDAASQAA